MIDPTKPEKLIHISPPSNVHPMTFETVDGRDTIAEQIKKDIDEYCEQAFDDGPRSHLGASVIGASCERWIWYQFRWMVREKMSGRMQRLVNRGHLEEERIIGYLRGIGMQVIATDDHGKQIRIVDVKDHFGGSIDGKTLLPERYGLQPTKMLLEMKTANDRIFKLLAGSGVIKEKPVHWLQMCIYGYKLGIKYALYIAASKNTDELAIEVLELDWVLAQKEIAKAEKVIFAIIPPMRIAQNPSYYECKFCPAHAVCHLNGAVNKNCRSCQHSKPADNGTWYCNQWQAVIPLSEIPKGCDAWQTFLH